MLNIFLQIYMLLMNSDTTNTLVTTALSTPPLFWGLFLSFLLNYANNKFEMKFKIKITINVHS